MARLNNWQPDKWEGSKGFRRRDYRNYDTYVAHQREGMQLRREMIMGRFTNDADMFRHNFKNLEIKDKNVLCIGARSGAEVQAFIDLDNTAIGIDLEPATKRDLVIKGDMHNLQFGDNEFDVVYTNIFDHVYDLEKSCNEIKRVLKPKGVFILEAVVGYDEGGWPGDHEAAYWSRAEELIKVVMGYGFDIKGKIKPVPICKGLKFHRAILTEVEK